MSSPWLKIQPVEGPISFDEITSEELAKSLQKKEFEKLVTTIEDKKEVQEQSELYEIDGTDSDEVIAHMLQAQYNSEHDLQLKRTENKFNRNSKVNILYSNYRVGPTEPEVAKPTVDDDRDIDHFVEIEKEYACLQRCGYKKIINDDEQSQIVTKHDILMSSRMNACRVLEFPPGIETGDTGGFDVKLGNRVFNDLRAHSHAHCSRQKSKAKHHAKPAKPKKNP